MKVLNGNLRFLAVMCLAVAPSDVLHAGEAVDVEVFKAPVSIELEQPDYPGGNLRNLKEGWVNVHFMVDASGKPYEPMVTDSTGDKAFEREAVKTVMRSIFEPASLNGETLDAGHALKVTFAIEGADVGGRSGFGRTYKQLMKAVDKRDQPRAQELLALLESKSVHNLYEDAFLHLAKYSYAAIWGDKATQLAAITRAIAHEKKENYLSEALFTTALQQAFSLQVQLQDFGAALQTWAKLESRDISEATRDSLQRVVSKIEALKDDDQAFRVTGEIGDNNHWSLLLLKDEFYLDEVTGELAELKLRCDRKYVFFRYQPEIQYNIPGKYGSCHLQIVGNPGTTFGLVQR